MTNGTQVATGIVEGLKQQPILLGLLAINLIFVLLIYFSVLSQRNHEQDMIDKLCVPATPELYRPPK